MVHVAVNNYDFEKNQHFRVRFWGGGHQKAYAVYAFINVAGLDIGYVPAGPDAFFRWSGQFGPQQLIFCRFMQIVFRRASLVLR